MKHTTKLASLMFLLFLSSLAFGQKKQSKQPDAPKPFVLGVIDEIQSTVLSEKRTLNIYLPEGYKEGDTTRYAVIYLLDGGADEDFIHIVGLVQYNSFPWIERIPKTIVVGIANVDRRRDFTYASTRENDKKLCPTGGHSDKFISFIETELQPYIEKKYKTTSSKTIIGESLGGLLAAEILLKKPKLFTQYIIVSPSLWWDDASLLKQPSELLNESYAQKADIYIGVGKEGLAILDPPHVMEVDANLLAEKLSASKSKNVSVHFDYLPEENHATVSHQAVLNAFRILNPVKKK